MGIVPNLRYVTEDCYESRLQHILLEGCSLTMFAIVAGLPIFILAKIAFQLRHCIVSEFVISWSPHI